MIILNFDPCTYICISCEGLASTNYYVHGHIEGKDWSTWHKLSPVKIFSYTVYTHFIALLWYIRTSLQVQ